MPSAILLSNPWHPTDEMAPDMSLCYPVIDLNKREAGLYEGCSNMNASSFITFFTFMPRQNVIPFWKELFLAFQMAPNVKKHSLFFSSYRPLYKGRSSILKFF